MLNKCSKEGKVCTLQIWVDGAIEVGVLDDQPLLLLGFHQLLFHRLDLGLRLLDALLQGPLFLTQAPDDDLIKEERVEVHNYVEYLCTAVKCPWRMNFHPRLDIIMCCFCCCC